MEVGKVLVDTRRMEVVGGGGTKFVFGETLPLPKLKRRLNATKKGREFQRNVQGKDES